MWLKLVCEFLIGCDKFIILGSDIIIMFTLRIVRASQF